MIKKIYNKYTEQINYLIFGFLTTVISIGSYYILVCTILDPKKPIQLQIANVISWITCVTFAYITNRKYVFKSKNNQIIKEITKFYIARLVLLPIDMISMYILVTKLNYNDKIIKIIVQIAIIILNYIFSKLYVFNNKKSM